jgi:hypothetical protein
MNKISKIVVSLFILLCGWFVFNSEMQFALAQEQDRIFFIDKLEEIVIDPPLEEIDVQIGISGAVGEKISLSVKISEILTDKNEVVDFNNMFKGESNQTLDIVLDQTSLIETFTFHFSEDFIEVAKGTYSALLEVTLDSGETIIKKITINAESSETLDVSILSPKIIINAIRCPWIETFRFLCGEEFSLMDSITNSESKYLQPYIAGESRIIIQGDAKSYIGVEGVAVDENGRGQVYIQLWDVKGINECWCQNDIRPEEENGYECKDESPLICAYKINVRDRGNFPPKSGEFKGTFYLDPFDMEESPNVEAIVRLREHITGAYFYLIAGILATASLTLIYGGKPKTEGTSSRRPKKILNYVGKFLQIIVLLLAGIYTVYHLNPVYGTHTDHIYSFLWAPTISVVAKIVGEILDRSPFEGFKDLIKF